MTLITRYLIKQLSITTLYAMFALLALYSFFDIVAEVGGVGEGGYTGEEKKVLYSVVTRLEVNKLKETVLSIDENAFVTINAVHDIVGGRFKKSGH